MRTRLQPEQITLRDGALHIEGYPDAVRLIRLKGHKARQLAHYAAHRSDLQAAESYLDNMRRDFPEPVNDALWRSAISTYIKCFTGDSARTTKLRAKTVYKNDTVRMAGYNYFENLRNKHIQHDENAFAQAIPCAAINGGGKDKKIEGVFGLTLNFGIIDNGNYGNLHILIAEADSWVANASEEISASIALDLEQKSLADLLAQDPVSMTVPTVGQVGVRRPDDA